VDPRLGGGPGGAAGAGPPPGEPAGVHPIEAESYRIMESEVDLSGWPAGARDVVARMVHATADEGFARTARIGERAVAEACRALAAAAPVVCDARMVVAGIPGVAGAVCLLREVAAAPEGSTRSAEAFRRAAARHPDGALWVVGNAPTALWALLDLWEAGSVRPAAVVGLPVGYVGAAEAKERLWCGGLAAVSITNQGRRGGSPVAAAAVNALARLAARARGGDFPGPARGISPGS